MLLRHCCGVLILIFFMTNDSQGIIIEGPSNVTYIPGRTPLPITLTCNITGFPSWGVNGTVRTIGNLRAGIPEGHNISGSNIVINIPVNDTEYICISSVVDADDVTSPPAFLYIAGIPAMVGNIMIDITTVTIDNNVNFTLNWDEPFANFDPIMNYTITINCNDAQCPVMFTVTTTSANVSFITDLSMMTPLSVTATNTIGTSDPTTIIIVVPDDVGMVNLTCGAVDLINQCTVTWNAPPVNDPSVVAVPITYNVYYFGDNITNGSIPDIGVSMATIDLPAVDSDVNVFVTAMNVFGSGSPSNIVLDEIMASSVTDATATLDTPNENRTLHSITVNCTIPDSTANMCEVIATANGLPPRIGTAPITNEMATVTINGLECGVTYNITAGGTLDGQLVGPRSSHGTITAGPCPPPDPTTTVATTSMTSTVTPTVMTTTTTTTTATTPSQSSISVTDDGDDNTGAIVGGVVGGIVAAIIIIIIIIIVVFYCMKKKREKSSRPISPGDKVAFRPASGVKVQTLDRYGKPVVEGENTDTGVELTGYTSKSPELTVTQIPSYTATSTGQATTFQGNDYQTAPSDEKNRTPSAFMPEGSYDTLAPADEPPAPSAQVIPPAQNGSNPNAPKLNYAELEQFTRKPASVKKPEPQPSSQYAVIDPKSLQQGTYT